MKLNKKIIYKEIIMLKAVNFIFNVLCELIIHPFCAKENFLHKDKNMQKITMEGKELRYIFLQFSLSAFINTVNVKKKIIINYKKKWKITKKIM